MPELCFEDFPAGFDLPEATLAVEAEDAAFFIGHFGPGAGEPDAPIDADPPLSGFHVAALGMRLLFDAVLARTAGLGAPGIEEVTWPNPVRCGDTLRFTGRIETARASASRPERGLVTVAIAIFNQHDACVMTQRNVIIVARRVGRGPGWTESGA